MNCLAEVLKYFKLKWSTVIEKLLDDQSFTIPATVLQKVYFTGQMYFISGKVQVSPLSFLLKMSDML